MAGIVRLEATWGELKGQVFTYTENIPRLYIGRNTDCGIVVPEATASRYHCVLEIIPPKVRLQDFGSLNGTYLNGRLIGRRERGQSAEEAQKGEYELVTLKNGAVLGLGKSCEFLVSIQETKLCSCCAAEILIEEDTKQYSDAEGKPLCEKCAREQEEKANALKSGERLCARCKKPFVPLKEDNRECPECLAERGRIIDDALAALRLKLPQVKPNAPAGVPSILEGYDKIAVLGKGGMGEVARVRRRSDGKEFALKTMQSDIVRSEHSQQLFLREASISKYIRHPNAVQSYDVGVALGMFYILMEICEGGSAQDRMERNGGKLSPGLATYITLQSLSGLDYVHHMDLTVHVGEEDGGYDLECKGIVHRDFKPGNIFLCDKSDHPLAKVADFGLAKAVDTSGMSNLSQTGVSVSGTYGFMSREQAINCKYAKAEVDVWSCVASYYCMLTGEVPKEFSAKKHPLNVVVSDEAVPIRKRDRSIPAALAELIDFALVEQPKMNFTTASAFRAALVDALPNSIRDYCEDIL